MTSNMIGWIASAHENTHRGEPIHARRARARSSFAAALAELQAVVDQMACAGASRRELAHTPAFRQGVARARAFRGELAVIRA